MDRYKLSFNAPGYYYRREKAREMSINIVYNGSDYHDEHQPKEVLYDRDVISYVFKYKGEVVQPDSVKLNVERLCKCKLTFITDSLSVERDPGYQPSIAHLMPEKGRHYYGLASLSKDVTIGFRNKPNYTREVIPEVRFFYKQSAAQIRRGMTQY